MTYPRLAAAAFLIAIICGCSHQKTLSREDLRSDLTKSISFASETELLATFVDSGHNARHYAQEHASFLLQEIDDSMKEIAKAKVDAEDEKPVNQMKKSLTSLASDLSTLRSSSGDNAELESIAKRAAAIRNRLASVKAGL